MSPEIRLAKQRHAKWKAARAKRMEEDRQERAQWMEEHEQKWEKDRLAHAKRMEENRQARAKRREELKQKMEEDRLAHAQWMEEHERKMEEDRQGRAARIAQQENSFREGFDFDNIYALVKILRIIFQVLLLPMTIGLFIVKASLFPRNSVFNKLFDFLDFFSLFGE